MSLAPSRISTRREPIVTERWPTRAPSGRAMSTEPRTSRPAVSSRRKVNTSRPAGQAGAEGPVIDIYVLRSFAEYLWDWLEDAGAEYGVTIVT